MDEIEWNVINEGQLLDAMVGHKPVGINRNFQMACICDKFADNIQRDISSAKVWQHLETMYNLDVLNESERMPFPNAESDFALDESEFGEIMLLKKDEDKKQVQQQQQQRPNTPKGRETPKLIKEISKNSEKAQIISATPANSVANTPKSSGVGGNSTSKDQQQTPQARRDSKDNINSNTNNNTTKDKDTTTTSTSTITSSSATVGNKTPNIPKKEIGNATNNSNNNKKESEKTMATNKSAKITKNNTASTTTNATVAVGNNSATVGNTASASSKEDSASSGVQPAIKSGVAKASGRTNSEDGGSSSSTTPKLPAIKRPLRGSFKPDDLATGGSANVSTNNGGKSSSPVTVATSGGGQSSAKRRRI